MTNKRHLIALLPLAFLLPPAAFAQTQTKPAKASAASPSAASPAPTAAKRTITIVVPRPGSYALFVPGQAGLGTFSAGDRPTITTPLESTTKDVHVLDQTAGTAAIVPVGTLKDGQKVVVEAGDFKYLGAVSVSVTATGGKPVASGAVTLTDSAGQAHSHLLTANENGVAQFETIPVGKATVTAASSADGPKATQETILAPAKGGGPTEITIALSGNVPTLDKPNMTASVPAGAAPAATAVPAEPPTNNWIPGVVGLGLMAAGIFYGVRYLKTRGVTVEDALKKMGVELPQDALATSAAIAEARKPVAPALPPLPSLTDLPAAGPAPTAAAASTFAVASATGTAVRTTPRLVGLAGAVTGEAFDLEAGRPFSVGRDDENSLALAQDKGVSRRHARIERSSDGWAVTDEGSSNGTFVNGTRVSGTLPLRAGDEIQVGGARFRFEG